MKKNDSLPHHDADRQHSNTDSGSQAGIPPALDYTSDELRDIFNQLRPQDEQVNGLTGKDGSGKYNLRTMPQDMGLIMLGGVVSPVEMAQQVDPVRLENVENAAFKVAAVDNWDFFQDGETPLHNRNKAAGFKDTMDALKDSVGVIYSFLDLDASMAEVESGQASRMRHELTTDAIGNKLVGCAKGHTRTNRRASEDVPHIQKTTGKMVLGRTHTITEPIPIDVKSVETIKASHPAKRHRAIAHAINPHRFAGSHTEEHVVQSEAEHVATLIMSLNPSLEKDLLAVDAYTYFNHSNIGRPDLADEVLDLLSNPRAKQCVIDAYNSAEQQLRYAHVRAANTTNNELAKLNIPMLDPHDPVFIAASKEARVTVHMGIDAIAGIILEHRRLLNQFEAKRTINNRNTLEFQRESQSRMGILSMQDQTHERPIYGALTVGETDKTLIKYGECIVTLKPEIAMNRTIYALGDSGSHTGIKAVNYAGALSAKIALGSTSDRIRFGYIEAMVLGGVDLDDIEMITLPKNYLEHYPEAAESLYNIFERIEYK